GFLEPEVLADPGFVEADEVGGMLFVVVVDAHRNSMERGWGHPHSAVVQAPSQAETTRGCSQAANNSTHATAAASSATAARRRLMRRPARGSGAAGGRRSAGAGRRRARPGRWPAATP